MFLTPSQVSALNGLVNYASTGGSGGTVPTNAALMNQAVTVFTANPGVLAGLVRAGLADGGVSRVGSVVTPGADGPLDVFAKAFETEFKATTFIA